MELSVIREPNLVVAIDVGSTYSGYAWQWKSDFLRNKSNVEFNTRWGQGAPELHKTNTAILLKIEPAPKCNESPRTDDVSVVEFGYSAERRYSNLCSQKAKDLDSYYLFKKFKLQLYRLKDGEDTEPLMVEDSVGRLHPLFDVLSKFIGALKGHFLTHKLQQTLDINTVLWVLTVPAIWSEKAKKFMRDAAEHSGIDRRHLLLASEPEAAAIYCINLPEEQKEIMNIGLPGHKFLTVDIGGGTADLSAVEVLPDGLLKELCKDQGLCVGGQNVNEAFFQSCHNSFSGTAWTALLSKSTPNELLKMEHEFEKMKITIGSGDSVDELISLPVPKEIRQNIQSGAIQVTENSNILTADDELMFKSDFIRKDLFQETCGLIYNTIQKVLATGEQIQTVVLVGGFAESSIMQENVRSKLHESYPNVKVVVPTSPFRAVLKGAVLYGHDRFIYRSRISRATYGVGTNSVFKEGKHSLEKKWFCEFEGVSYCKDIFSMHIREGQAVQLNAKQPSIVYAPMHKNQTKMGLPLFMYNSQTGHDQKDCIIYTTDAGCTKIGEILVEIEKTEDSKDWKVEVAMIYGGTQLSVIATCTKSGKEYPADIKF